MREKYFAKYNDIQILEIVNSFRFLPLQVLTKILIEKKLYRSYQAVSRTINRLKGFGLIRTTYFTNNAKIIFLSREGAKQLATGTGVSEDNINCPERLTGVNFFALEHTVRVANLYLLILRECQKHSLTLKKFTGDHFTRYEYIFRSNATAKKIKRYILPDAEVEIIVNNSLVRLWLEYDRGTEYSKDVAVKYMKYFEYFYYNQEVREEFPKIIFITESTKERLNNLIVQEPEYKDVWEWKFNNKAFKNVVLRGVGMTENIRTINHSAIESYLKKDRFLFVDYSELEKRGFESKFLNRDGESTSLSEIFKQLTEKEIGGNM